MNDRREAIDALTVPGERYELGHVDSPNGRVRTFVNAPATLWHLYEGARCDDTFLVYGDERLSYAEALDRASALAVALRDEYGVRAGDRVGIAMRNYPEWMIGFMAATSLGAIAVAINSMWQGDELAYAVSDCSPSVLLCDAERYERLVGVGDVSVPVVVARGDGVNRFDDLVASGAHGWARGEPLNPALGADAPATILYTSGSTGHPKGVVSTHRQIMNALTSWELDAAVARRISAGSSARTDAGRTPSPGPRRQSATIAAVPLFHATGLLAVFLLSFRSRRKVICMYRWDPDAAAQIIEVEQVDSFMSPPTMTADLLRIGASGRYDLSSLRLVGGGGAPRPPRQVGEIDRVFTRANANNGWGMTETNAIGTALAGDDYRGRPDSSGRVSAVLDLAVWDDDGQSLPPGQAGELMVRGGSVFSGYWNRDNADTFRGGWFPTGDVAYLDGEGYLFIVDRIKDLIIRGGENIGCGTVEAALAGHPGVFEAAVYSVPDERMGEEVGATVYGEVGLDADDVLAFVARELAAFEVPRFLRVVHAPLPRLGTEKLDKRRIRAEALAALA